MLRLIALALAVSALLTTPAFADKDFILGPGTQPSVIVEANSGVADIAWAEPKAHKVHYCKLARDATSCAVARDLDATLTGENGFVDEPGWPTILRDTNGDLVIVLAQYVIDKTFIYRSTDNGNSWSGPTQIYATGLHGAEPDMIVDPATREVVIAKFNVYHRVAGIKLDGSEAAKSDVAELDTAGLSINYKAQVARAPDGTLVVVGSSLEGPDHDAFAWAAAAGTDPSQTTSWSSAPARIGPGEEAALAGGPSGVFGVFGAFSTNALTVRKWTGGTGFTPGVAVGRAGYPDIDVAASGVIGVVARIANESWFTLSRNSGASFSPAVRIGTRLGARQHVALASDGKGVTVYDAVPDPGGPAVVRVATTDPIAAAPPAGGGSNLKPAKTVVTKEGTYTLSGIPRCVQAGTSFRVTLGFKRAKRKGNVVVKVRKAKFSYQGKTKYSTTRPPFRATFRVLNAQPGKTYVLRARAFLKVRHGPKRSRSIKSTTKVC